MKPWWYHMTLWNVTTVTTIWHMLATKNNNQHSSRQPTPSNNNHLNQIDKIAKYYYRQPAIQFTTCKLLDWSWTHSARISKQIIFIIMCDCYFIALNEQKKKKKYWYFCIGSQNRFVPFQIKSNHFLYVIDEVESEREWEKGAYYTHKPSNYILTGLQAELFLC